MNGNGGGASKTWWPTRKWWAATLVAAFGILSSWGANGFEWTDAMSAAAITLAGQSLVAYLVPNQDTPGGVPTKSQ